MNLNEWVFIGLFLALSWVFPAVPILLGKWLAPNAPTLSNKTSTNAASKPLDQPGSSSKSSTTSSSIQ
jgi:hypothetical protein